MPSQAAAYAGPAAAGQPNPVEEVGLAPEPVLGVVDAGALAPEQAWHL